MDTEFAFIITIMPMAIFSFWFSGILEKNTRLPNLSIYAVSLSLGAIIAYISGLIIITTVQIGNVETQERLNSHLSSGLLIPIISIIILSIFSVIHFKEFKDVLRKRH